MLMCLNTKKDGRSKLLENFDRASISKQQNARLIVTDNQLEATKVKGVEGGLFKAPL